jgi:hypothetical protein
MLSLSSSSTLDFFPDASVDKVQGAEEGKIPDYNDVRKEKARQREARCETLRKRVANNGFALRKNGHGRNQ